MKEISAIKYSIKTLCFTAFLLAWPFLCIATGVPDLPRHWRPMLIDQRVFWVWAQEPSAHDLADVNALVRQVYESTNHSEVSLVEKYIQDKPNSGWTLSLENSLASYDLKHAQFTPALQLWESVWQQSKHYEKGQEGKMVADYALAHLVRLLASLGRYDTLTDIFRDTKGRVLDRGPLSEMFNHTKEGYAEMRVHPEISFRCGTLAMQNVCHVLYGTNYDYIDLNKVGSTTNGFTLQELVGISSRLKLGLVPITLAPSGPLIVPSVVNWRQHHYGAITGIKYGLYEVLDPTMLQPRYLTAEEIKSEASGYYLIASKDLNSDCRVVSTEEARNVYGKGNPLLMSDQNDQPCSQCPCPIGAGPGGGSGPSSAGGNGPGPLGCSTCSSSSSQASGMPQWSVSEPYIDLWFQDEPLGYQPAIGPRLSFKIYYHDNAEFDIYRSVLGNNWTCEWFQSAIPIYGEVLLMLPGGGYSTFTPGEGNDYYNNCSLSIITNSVTVGGPPLGATLIRPDASEDVYSCYTNAQGNSSIYLMLQQQVDPQGNSIQFYYTNFIPSDPYNPPNVSYVVDASGQTNTLSYAEDEYGGFYVTNVTDPFGRGVNIAYDESSIPYSITNLTDVIGMSSSMIYDENGFPTNLTTVYGTTTFQKLINLGGDSGFVRADLITDPAGGNYLYYFNQGGTWIELPNSLVPTNTPIGTINSSTFGKDSFYWDPRQYLLLSTNFLDTFDVTQFTTNDFIESRTRNWLGVYLYTGEHPVTTIDTLSFEEKPSPDGINYGAMTWYDYPGKLAVDWSGTQILPGVTAWVMPDGSTSYVWDQRDSWGHVTNEVAEWFENGQNQYRTNVYIYATNGLDIVEHIRPDGVGQMSSSYDTHHRILASTNGVGEITTYTYNILEQLTSVVYPSGLLLTNIYAANNFLSQQIDVGISTNSFSYNKDLLMSQVDARGLVTSNTWDNLNRLTSVTYPDSTYVSNCYTYLDLGASKDRIGAWTYYGYDPMRRKIAETNALGNFTLYSYCTCGSLEEIVDALNHTTHFYYDNAGRLTNTDYADGYSIQREYDSQDRLVATLDSSGNNIIDTRDNHNLLLSVSNNVGSIQMLSYDIDDRITNNIDANNVSVYMTYDNLNRLRTKIYPDNGIDSFGYSYGVSGATSYTNQVGWVTRYAYNKLDWKTNEVIVGVTTNSFVFNGAGDLLSLTDGKSQTTAWGYDQFGRVTNKLDAANNHLFSYQYDPDSRLTNRWSAAKGTTVYLYDVVGNLTNVNYFWASNSMSTVSLAYDPLNRLTQMVDAVGTTTYTYDGVGQVLSEVGPWPSDAVNYSYANRLRQSMSVQAPNSSPWAQSYGYDNARRLNSLASPAGTFGYIYDPIELDKIEQLNLPNGAFITNTFDNVARLLSTRLINSSATVLDSESYGYNLASQRYAETNTAGDFRNYTYDNEGELTSAIGKEAGGTTNRWQEQLKYAYDAAGNLGIRTNNALVQVFNVNDLNELSVVSNTGALTVAGTTTSPATNVTVNSLASILYADRTFASTNQSWVSGNNTYTAIAHDVYGRISTNSVTVNVEATNGFTYDLNGNLLSDGNRNFSYNDENELISAWVANVWSNNFVYDGKMRRRIERDYSWSGSSWTETNEVHFIYDGNVVIQERNASNLPMVTYTRGNDLSGTLQGAGGIGGLLARSDNTQIIIGNPSAHAYYHSDGNGNVTMLVNNIQGVAAKYLYDPFGNTLSMSGPLATANAYRFSSKEWNGNSGLYYYLYRFYDPNLQRWISKDLLGEIGFESARQLHIPKKGTTLRLIAYAENTEYPNLYECFANTPLSMIDKVGLFCWCDHSTDSDLESCLLCALQNKINRQVGQVISAGSHAAAGSGAEYVDPLGVVGAAELAHILSELDSSDRITLLRGEYAKELLDCVNKFPGENAQQAAKNQYDTTKPN